MLKNFFEQFSLVEQCPSCGHVLADQYRSVEEGAQARPPACPDCHCAMSWIPAIGRMDLLSDGSDGAKFEMYDGQNQKVEVGSFAQMHKLERESNQQFRNGEGQPILFRALHQSKSQMGVNTFGEAPTEQPTAASKAKFGFQGATRVLSGEPDVTFGPGVHEGNTSALKD